jgi:hypothetical protein
MSITRVNTIYSLLIHRQTGEQSLINKAKMSRLISRFLSVKNLHSMIKQSRERADSLNKHIVDQFGERFRQILSLIEREVDTFADVGCSNNSHNIVFLLT